MLNMAVGSTPYCRLSTSATAEELGINGARACLDAAPLVSAEECDGR